MFAEGKPLKRPGEIQRERHLVTELKIAEMRRSGFVFRHNRKPVVDAFRLSITVWSYQLTRKYLEMFGAEPSPDAKASLMKKLFPIR